MEIPCSMIFYERLFGTQEIISDSLFALIIKLHNLLHTTLFYGVNVRLTWIGTFLTFSNLE